MGKHELTVRYEEIETAIAGDSPRLAAKQRVELTEIRLCGKTRFQGFHNGTECQLAVGVAYRQVATREFRIKVYQVSVVGKYPILPPKLPHKRMGVLQLDFTDAGLTNMSDYIKGFDRIPLDQIGDH